MVMWWKRRPAGAGRLMAPPPPANAALWRTGVVLMGVLGLCFPLTGAVLLAVWSLDTLLFSRIPMLKATVN
jgi:uncharacterized iron-regulated membrane protein